jgi:hypothetical protein
VDGCWVAGCDGEHDQYMHPLHNCKPPDPVEVQRGTVWACPAEDCPKTWRVTQTGTHPGHWGWALYELVVPS